MGESRYKSTIADETAGYFPGKLMLDKTGKEDVSDNLQRLIDEIKNEYGYGIIFIEEGTYLISKTILIPKGIRLIGVGKTRPKFVLKDNVPLDCSVLSYDKGSYKYMFWFVDLDMYGVLSDANPGTFYSAMTNIDIDMGHGNTNAVALRTHYAQHSFISFIDIHVNDAMAGIYDVGNEMESVAIYGGNYAIITTKCSPGWPFAMVDTYFANQKIAAIKTHEAGLTIVRNKTENVPTFLTVDEGYFERVYMEDCIVNDIDTLLDIDMYTNSLTQIRLKNIYTNKKIEVARYRENGKTVTTDSGCFDYLHGTVADENNNRKIEDKCIQLKNDGLSDRAGVSHNFEKIKKQGGNFETSEKSGADIWLPVTDLKRLPETDEWVDVTKLGLVGDGITDNTESIKGIIDKYDNLYFPQGDYLFTDTVKLKEKTKIIALHPFSTKLVLKDNCENYTGFGKMKPFVEVPENGENIINGIGIDTGGRNPRACALLWKGGSNSYANDVKLIGGHGTLEPGTGAFVMPYNESRSADFDVNKQWDAQYASFIVTGGGTFKDIWSASPYAMAGFEVRNSNTPSNVYCMSLEHHQRNEIIINNSSNWNFYALQMEEEVAEGEYAVPVEMNKAENITFNMTYFFRTVFVKTPSDYCVKYYDCDNIEFNCINNVTQMKYTFGDFALNATKNKKIRPWQMAHVHILEADNVSDKMTEGLDKSSDDIKEIKYRIVKEYNGFRFADGGTKDSKGNFYFIDSMDKRVYMIDNETLDLKLVLNSPIKINSLTIDTEDNLIGIGEYIIPNEATKDGEEIVNILPPDSLGTSYGYWYNRMATIVVFKIEDGRIYPIDEVANEGLTPEWVCYPGNRWRDGSDFKEVMAYKPETAFILPDGKTVMPKYYDLLRANNTAKAKVGEVLYSVDEMYKRVFRANVKQDGTVDNVEAVSQMGDFCARKTEDGLLVGDDNIYLYREGLCPSAVMKFPWRTTTFETDVQNKNIRYITTAHKVFVVEETC